MTAELRTLIPATGIDLETRTRCQDNNHPVGAVHPYWFDGQPGSFCHCGRVIYRGVRGVVRWRPATDRELAWERMDAKRKPQPAGQLELFGAVSDG